MSNKKQQYDFIKRAIDKSREKLLDLTTRNPLLSTRISYKSNGYIHAIDEQPQQLYENIADEKVMEFIALPSPEEDPRDEQSEKFKEAFKEAQKTDEDYLRKKIITDKSGQKLLDRELKDKLRQSLGMKERFEGKQADQNEACRHAENNLIFPDYDLPLPSRKSEDGRHGDKFIQTLLLPEKLQGKMKALTAKSNEWNQETGINVLNAAFGFLEWQDSQDSKSRYAPLLLLPIEIKKEKTGSGFKFKVSGMSEDIERNLVLNQKLQRDFGIKLPDIKLDSAEPIENYFKKISKELSETKFKLRRWVVFGVFPSQRMAMYHDLDPKKYSFEDNKLLEEILAGNENGDAEAALDTPFSEEYNECGNVKYHDADYFYPVLDSDPSQFSVLQLACSGENLAIEGPPGTGKSQTIVNIIAAAMGSGKKVLFVAEKMAALEVVKNRLDAIGLGEFALPLQASRSNRSDVIKSIRERIEMRAEKVPEEYALEVKRFQKIKRELNDYCDTIGQEFKNTELTIFDIQSKNIAETKFVNDHLSLFKNDKINELEIYSKNQITELCNLGENIANFYSEVKGISSYWEGQKINNINKFTVDKICDLTKKLALSYENLSEAQEGLISFGFREEITDRVLLNIKRILRILQNYRDLIDTKLVIRLSHKDNYNVVLEFQDSCKKFEQMTASKEETGISVRDFLGSMEDGKNFTVGSIEKAYRIISETSDDILDLRPLDSRNHSNVETKVENLIKSVKKVQKLQRVIEASISLDGFIPDEYEIQRSLSNIMGSNIFSFLFTDYRNSRNLYMSMSKIARFDKQVAIKDLQALYKWKKYYDGCKRELEDIFTIEYLPNGDMLERLHALQKYYQSINAEIKGSRNENIRSFLKFEKSIFLHELPDISKIIYDDGIESKCKLVDFINDFSDYYENFENKLNKNSKVKDILLDNFHGAETDFQIFSTEMKILKLLQKPFMREMDIKDSIVKIFETNKIGNALIFINQKFQLKEEIINDSEDLGNEGIALSLLIKGENYSEIYKRLYGASEDRKGLDIHSQYNLALDDIRDKKMEWVVEELLKEKGNLSELSKAIENLIFYFLQTNIYRDDSIVGVLSKHKGQKRSELQKHLSEIDKNIIKMHRSCLRSKLKLASDPPYGVKRGSRKTWTNMALIENELEKKTRFVSVRLLTQNAGEALQELKPCWMMSPLAVAQYLPHGTVEFDLCIIDEASQMPPEEALGALARSGQAVIVGDTNQLPPTSFFKGLHEVDEKDEEEGALIDDSILDTANIIFRPKKRLLWHYRSKHDSLINFSNHFIYENRLVIAPPSAGQGNTRGVSLRYVNGVYKNSINLIEVERVIDEVLKFMRNRPKESLGVVTLNARQKEKLEEYWEHALMQHSLGDTRISDYLDYWDKEDDGLQAFFIKNLENVQGDERDVIFISTVYGPEVKGGKVAQRFGPINGPGGKRRLNVLFSRAKHQIVTFTSMKANDIIADENKPGSYMLKEWLRYSETGRLPIGIASEREPDSDFEIFVAEQIRSMGCEAVPQVGSSQYYVDIGVKHPRHGDDFIMGVECDGASYHSTADARARDILRQEILENNGWHIYRIWSTDWFNHQVEEVSKLRLAIEKRLEYLENRESENSQLQL